MLAGPFFHSLTPSANATRILLCAPCFRTGTVVPTRPNIHSYVSMSVCENHPDEGQRGDDGDLLNPLAKEVSAAGKLSPVSSIEITLEMTDISVSLQAKVSFPEATVGIGTCHRSLQRVGWFLCSENAAQGGTSAVAAALNKRF
jgi:hypothetical protein